MNIHRVIREYSLDDVVGDQGYKCVNRWVNQSATIEHFQTAQHQAALHVSRRSSGWEILDHLPICASVLEHERKVGDLSSLNGAVNNPSLSDTLSQNEQSDFSYCQHFSLFNMTDQSKLYFSASPSASHLSRRCTRTKRELRRMHRKGILQLLLHHRLRLRINSRTIVP